VQELRQLGGGGVEPTDLLVLRGEGDDRGGLVGVDPGRLEKVVR